jgi:hypothetical protein
MTIKIISNRDGATGDRATTFTSYEPNTYSVERDGVKIGDVDWQDRYPLSRINPTWGGRGAWVFCDLLGEYIAKQKLNDLRASLKLIFS